MLRFKVHLLEEYQLRPSGSLRVELSKVNWGLEVMKMFRALCRTETSP